MRRSVALVALVLAGCGAASQQRAAQAPRNPVAPTPPAVRAAGCPSTRHPRERRITRRRWLSHVGITEYYSIPERFFRGVKVHAPGLSGRHRVDWLYSSRGVSMEGDGVGLDRRHYHIDALGSGGWVNRAGHHTVPGACPGHWSRGRPAWLEGGWRNSRGWVTFPLEHGGWSNGRGVQRLGYGGVTFAPGSSLPLKPYRTAAVDPRLIPLGSRIYIPAYRRLGLKGWFVARDTGGAIIGRHIDVYRSPPRTLSDKGRFLRDERVLVVPPGG